MKIQKLIPDLRLILVIVILTLSVFPKSVFCQNNQYRFLIGGEVGGYFSKNEVSNFETYYHQTPINVNDDLHYNFNALNSKNISFNISPNLLYYINDNLLIGGGIEWLNIATTFNDKVIQTKNENSIVVYPAIRLYLIKGFFVQGQFDIGKTFYNVDCDEIYAPMYGLSSDKSIKTKGNVLGGGLMGGYSIDLGERVIVDVALKYIYHNNMLDIRTPRISEGTFNNEQSKIHLSFALKYRIKRKN